MIYKIAICLLLALFISRVSFLYAQTNVPNYKFEYLTTENGLTSNRNNCVFRDSNGFLWIGSDVGLDRFDGYTFKKYKNDENKPKSLSNNSVHCIFEDSNKNLWIGTSSGINLLNPNLDSFIIFKNITSDKNSIKSNNIIDIFEDSQRNLWFVSSLGCLNKWNPKTKNFQRFHIPNNDNENLTRVSRSIAEDSKGRLWIVSFSSELFQFNPKTGEFKSYSDPTVDLGENTKGLCVDNEDNVWVCTYGNGLFLYNIRTGKFKKFKIAQDGAGTNLGTICDVIQEDKTHIMIGVDQGGINRYNKETDRFEYIMYDENSDNGLNNNGIWSFYKDKEGIFYITSSGGGVTYIDPKKNKFKLFRHQSNNQQSLSFNFTGSFYQDNAGKIWIGTDGGGLNLFDPKTEKFKVFKHDPANPNSIAGNVIRSITEDCDNDLWIATWDAGLIRYAQKTGKFYTYSMDKDDPNYISERIWFIKIAHNNLIWIGLYNGGIILLDKTKGIVKRLKHDTKNQKSLTNNNIRYLYEDGQKNMWICTSNGLCRYDSLTQDFTRINNISNLEIRTLFIEKTGELWVGTSEKGLILLDKKGNLIRRFTENDGLSSNTIQAITEDNSGDLWISTNNSISHFIRSKGIFRNFSGTDGLMGNEFFNQSFLKTKNGELYFGGLNGFNSFFPDSLKDNPIIPQVIITDFNLVNTPSLAESEDHSLKHISACKSIFIRPGQNIFSFTFTATNLTYPENNQFAYKLEGFDEGWIYTNFTRRYVTYTNLNPGEYTFHVKASNNDGVWNENGVSLQITILPYWWNTLWFKTLVSIFFIISLIGFYFYRIKNLKRQKNVLEKMVLQRTIELEESNATLEEINISLVDKQEEINLQKEELISQKDDLELKNELLIEQKQQIVEQNNELDKHRYKLEGLIEERTSELLAAKIKAEESDRLKSSFLTNMSHEIRTPMNAIVGFSTLVRDVQLGETERTKMLNIILQNSESLLILINDILDLSKIETNQIELHASLYNILNTLEELVNSSYLLAQKKNLQLKLNANQIDPRFTFDTDILRFKQVFTNLIDNAIKFTENGKIEFGIQSINDKAITFFVRDTGIGIALDTGNSIFERFTKIESKNKLYRGTGLGLPICKSIVNLWKGEIWYESNLNSGTIFYFTHPFQSEKQVMPEIIESEALSYDDFSGKTILVAEDQETNYMLVETYLHLTNVKLIWAQNGKDAIEFALNNQIDLILMDIKMPVIDGIEATKQIKKVKPNLPIIAQTAYAFENEISEFSKHGLDAYIVKPFRANELIGVLKRVLRERS